MTFSEIKEMKNSGKRKFGKFLFLNVAHLYKEGYSHFSVAKFLENEHIYVTVKDLIYYKAKYDTSIETTPNNKNFQEIKKIESPIKNETPIKIPFDKLPLKEQLEKMEYMLDPANFPRELVKF